MAAVTLENISKQYRMGNILSNYRTLKTLLVRQNWSMREKNRKCYKEVLKDISLDIYSGSILGVIGKNGSGKTTLLKIIYGILRPDRGRVKIDGRVSAIIELGLGFHPDLTGRENLQINGIIMGLSKQEIKGKMDAIVDFSGIHSYIDEPLRTYSSGMCMRLGFAIAVHIDPNILLIDEVHTVGDESFRMKCEKKVEQLKKDGKTIVLVTHDLQFVENWCSRAVWLDDGIIASSGNPKEVIESYKQSIQNKEESLANEKDTGSFEVTITEIVLLDKDGEKRNRFFVEEDITIYISYSAKRQIEDAVFGIAICNQDGISIYGTNTYIDGENIPALKKGNNRIGILLKRTNLLEGEYTLDAAIHKRDGTPYHYKKAACSFKIVSEKKEAGICRLSHKWILNTIC